MDYENYDWSQFTRRIPIYADRQLIFNSWLTPNNLTSWFLSAARFYDAEGNQRGDDEVVQAGDRYEWEWFGWDIVEKNEFTFLDEYTIVFKFADICNVTVKVEDQMGTNILVVSQDNIPTDDLHKAKHHLGCSIGWLFYMMNLKCILEGGPDLRNKNDQLQQVNNC